MIFFSRVWIATGMMKIACKFQILVNVVTSPHLGTRNVKVRFTYQMMCPRNSEVFACRVRIHPHGFWELLLPEEVPCDLWATCINPYLNHGHSANKQAWVTDWFYAMSQRNRRLHSLSWCWKAVVFLGSSLLGKITGGYKLLLCIKSYCTKERCHCSEKVGGLNFEFLLQKRNRILRAACPRWVVQLLT